MNAASDLIHQRSLILLSPPLSPSLSPSPFAIPTPWSKTFPKGHRPRRQPSSCTGYPASASRPHGRHFPPQRPQTPPPIIRHVPGARHWSGGSVAAEPATYHPRLLRTYIKVASIFLSLSLALSLDHVKQLRPTPRPPFHARFLEIGSSTPRRICIRLLAGHGLNSNDVTLLAMEV